MANILDRERPGTAIPQLEKRIDELENSFIDRAYPVGSYYFTSNSSFDPSVSIGGVWELTNNSDPYKWQRKR